MKDKIKNKSWIIIHLSMAYWIYIALVWPLIQSFYFSLNTIRLRPTEEFIFLLDLIIIEMFGLRICSLSKN